jgi:HAD superfamily hydrolase (TIGR01484 family)
MDNTAFDPTLIIFDLDGTLAQSKAPLDDDMSQLLGDLLKNKKVAVISGASFAQFETQFLKHLHCKASQLNNLFILPEDGSDCFRYVKRFWGGKWKAVYQHKLSKSEKEKISDALKQAVAQVSQAQDLAIPKITYGEQIEDRGSEITFSALGQHAPLEKKSLWDANHSKREAIVKVLTPLLSEFDIKIGGATSIDITKNGMNKKFGIEAVSNLLHIPKSSILYVGDSIFPGGNDYAAVEAGVTTRPVRDVDETKAFIHAILHS